MKNIFRFSSFCFYLFSSLAVACSCRYVSLEEKIGLSENILIVEIHEIEVIEPANKENFVGGKRRGHFKVLETLKGSYSGPAFINSAEEPVCCVCQSKVMNKTKYLVFNDGSNEIHLSTCGLTKPISDNLEISEIVKSMLKSHKPTEIFTGIFISNGRLFVNDDGSTTQIVQLVREDYYAPASRISFEGIKLPSGKLMVTNLQEESALSDNEIKVLEEQRGTFLQTKETTLDILE
ncbi:MAG: hypothetical protein KUG78_11345 [Kangiellaceae bacterium]|nr:hypothetical protein [Kangiellaceae bacterium]